MSESWQVMMSPEWEAHMAEDKGEQVEFPIFGWLGPLRLGRWVGSCGNAVGISFSMDGHTSSGRFIQNIGGVMDHKDVVKLRDYLNEWLYDFERLPPEQKLPWRATHESPES